MRLSEWRRSAPNREAASPDVVAGITPVAVALGAEPDPHCWVLWGDDPLLRYTVLVPTRGGLAVLGVRVHTPEGPRTAGKLVRWSRLQLSELSVESQEGHRIVATQVEGQVLRGVDVEADRIAEFVRGLIAAADGHEWQPPAGHARGTEATSKASVKSAPESRSSAASRRRLLPAVADQNVRTRRRAGTDGAASA